ncbi:MAG: methyltransferase domain-containing protein [Nitrososphaera sp.]
MFTESHAQEQTQYHLEASHYGAGSFRWGESIVQLCQQFGVKTILDYGCGKGTLGPILADKVQLTLYDPFVDSFKERPVNKDFGLIVCTDVMEHIEVDKTRDVLTDIFYYTKFLVFFNIALTLARKKLPSGRNTHINIKTANEWARMLMQYFNVVSAHVNLLPNNSYKSLSFVGIRQGLELTNPNTVISNGNTVISNGNMVISNGNTE